MPGLLQRYGLYFAWLTALVATGGSLYFSEARHFVPCELCWFQRILMYPLVIVLGIASFRDDRAIAPYVLPMSTLGAMIALYHYLDQKVPALQSVPICGAGNPCAIQWIDWWGFVTIPLLALIAFLLVTLLLIGARSSSN